MAMAQRNIEMLLMIMSLVVVADLWGVTMGQSQSSCNNLLLSLSPCLDYITGTSSTPPSNCCSQLAFVVSSQPQCLCEVVNGGASSIAASLNINQTQALELPTTCNVQTPPISTCTGSASSASPTGVFISNIPNSPSGTGSNTVSSTTGRGGSIRGTSNANSSSTKSQYSLLVLVIFVNFTFTFITMT